MRTPSRITTTLKELAVAACEWLGTAGAMSTWSYRPPSAWEVQEITRRWRELGRPAPAGLRVQNAAAIRDPDPAPCCVGGGLPCSC